MNRSTHGASILGVWADNPQSTCGSVQTPYRFYPALLSMSSSSKMATLHMGCPVFEKPPSYPIIRWLYLEAAEKDRRGKVVCDGWWRNGGLHYYVR